MSNGKTVPFKRAVMTVKKLGNRLALDCIKHDIKTLQQFPIKGRQAIYGVLIYQQAMSSHLLVTKKSKGLKD